MAVSAGGVGGNIKVPRKLVDVRPLYPSNLGAARLGGVVVLEARIGTDGITRVMRTVSSTHQEFEAAAVEAVRQWEFSETLLNCQAVEVAMTVTVNFVIEP